MLYSGQTLRIAAGTSSAACMVYNFKDGEKIDEDILCHEKKIIDVKYLILS